jgi:hypothetical protein
LLDDVEPAMKKVDVSVCVGKTVFEDLAHLYCLPAASWCETGSVLRGGSAII